MNSLFSEEQVRKSLALLSVFANHMAKQSDFYNKGYGRIAKAHNLSQPQLLALIQIATCPEATHCNASYVAARVGLARNSIYQAIEGLEHQYLIERVRVKSARRRVEIRLTDFGRNRIMVLFPEVLVLYRQFIETMQESLTSTSIAIAFYDQS